MATNRRGQEKRAKARIDIGVVMPVHMVRVDGGTSVQCCLCDVAPTGIGVTVDEQLRQGECMEFRTLGKTWFLEVSWCERAEADDVWKCGLVLQDPSQDISVLFSSFVYKRA
jgi:hypothetical protein